MHEYDKCLQISTIISRCNNDILAIENIKKFFKDVGRYDVKSGVLELFQVIKIHTCVEGQPVTAKSCKSKTETVKSMPISMAGQESILSKRSIDTIS